MIQSFAGSLGLQLHSVALRYDGALAQRAGGGVQARGRPVSGIGGDGATAEVGPRDVRLARLEAVLILAKEPLASRKLAQLASLTDGTEARTLVGRLNRDYDDVGRAFRVEEIAGGYQMRTRSGFAPWLRRIVGAPAEIRMSGPSMETLAVVAYRQPVMRAEIEAVRGVQCGEILRQLMERSMVRIAGRADELGRPFLYGTTSKFLQVFGLRSLDELPRASMLRRTAETGEELDEARDECDGDDAESDVDAEADEKESIVTNQATQQETQDAAKMSEAQSELVENEIEGDDDIDDLDDESADEDDDDFDDDFDEDVWEEVEDEDVEGEDDDWDDDDDDDDDDWDDDEGKVT